MKLRIQSRHTSSYPDPVAFDKGDVLDLGPEDDEYPGWIWVTTGSSIQGWAPLDYIQVDAGSGIAVAKCRYSAKELNVVPGELIEVVSTLNGWHLGINSRGEQGWFPARCGDTV